MNLGNTEEITVLENSFALTIGEESFPLETDPDVVEQLLADTRSANTRRAYQKDIKDFFLFAAQRQPDRALILEFLHLEQHQATSVVLKYKASLIRKGLKEATVNRRLAAIKSMVVMGRKLGVCHFSLEEIKGEKIQNYRDTSGVEVSEYAQVLALVDRTSLKGKRDYAILRLLWDNALRRNEICSLNVGDFDARSFTLRILGKGRGTQKEVIDISRKTNEAITDWLIASGRSAARGDEPLFVSIAYNGRGQRLTGESVRRLVDQLCQQAGIDKKMSPHRVRHSAITAVLDKNNGNYRQAQKFSRHADPRTLIKYDDNRQRLQKQMTDLISDLV